jgi:hypothetical protein
MGMILLEKLVIDDLELDLECLILLPTSTEDL